MPGLWRSGAARWSKRKQIGVVHHRRYVRAPSLRAITRTAHLLLLCHQAHRCSRHASRGVSSAWGVAVSEVSRAAVRSTARIGHSLVLSGIGQILSSFRSMGDPLGEATMGNCWPSARTGRVGERPRANGLPLGLWDLGPSGRQGVSSCRVRNHGASSSTMACPVRGQMGAQRRGLAQGNAHCHWHIVGSVMSQAGSEGLMSTVSRSQSNRSNAF